MANPATRWRRVKIDSTCLGEQTAHLLLWVRGFYFGAKILFEKN